MSTDFESRLTSWLETPRGFALALAVLCIAIATTLFWRLDSSPVEHTTERRTMKVVDHMVESGDWLVPMKDDKPRLEKPPLYYWLGTLSTLAVSEHMTPGTLRFPSALMGLAMVLLATYWAYSLGGRRHALLTALLMLGMMHFFTIARRGVAETTLGAFTVAAWIVFDRMHFDGRKRWLPWFAACFAGAWMAKATVSLLLIGLPIAWFLGRERKLRPAISARLVAWLALALVVGLIWYVAVLTTVPGSFDVFRSELLNSAGAAEGESSARHYDWPHFYLQELPSLTLPTALLVPLLVWRLVTTKFHRDDPRRRFAAVTFVVLFVAWSILPKKQRHYMIPLLPSLAVLLADAAIALWATRRELFAKIVRPTAALLAIGAWLGAGYIALWLIEVRHVPAIWSYLGVGALALASIPLLVAGLRVRPATFAFGAFLALAPTMIATFCWVRPWEDEVRAAVDDKIAPPDEAHLLALKDRAPWVLKVYGVSDDVAEHAERLEKRRAKSKLKDG
ncbi:MAG: glycosyltransferase family 39 protein [Planctomycetes bacterium]|nr:glycosyltransferase family 39 protein [Planctomycetota bacterium]